MSNFSAASIKALVVDDSATMRSALNGILVSMDINVVGQLEGVRNFV
ncbi:MAG: hypothetical protein R8K20_06970 [Gallionellaceae bacterium]